MNTTVSKIRPTFKLRWVILKNKIYYSLHILLIMLYVLFFIPKDKLAALNKNLENALGDIKDHKNIALNDKEKKEFNNNTALMINQVLNRLLLIALFILAIVSFICAYFKYVGKL